MLTLWHAVAEHIQEATRVRPDPKHERFARWHVGTGRVLDQTVCLVLLAVQLEGSQACERLSGSPRARAWARRLIPYAVCFVSAL